MGKRFSIAFASVFAITILVSIFWHSHGYAHTMHIKQVKTPVISFTSVSSSIQDITPFSSCALYQKGKVPVDCKYIVRAKALNDYSSSNNDVANTQYFFLEIYSFIIPFKKQYTLYIQHICTVVCSPAQLRGPPSARC